jgi:hypothetical protein
MKIVKPGEQVSTKSTFCFWASVVDVFNFLKIPSMQFYEEDCIFELPKFDQNRLNNYGENRHFLLALIFVARNFKFLRHRAITGKLLNAKYEKNLSNHSGCAEGHSHTHRHTTRQTAFEKKVTFFIRGSSEHVILSKFRDRLFYDHSTFSYILRIGY